MKCADYRARAEEIAVRFFAHVLEQISSDRVMSGPQARTQKLSFHRKFFKGVLIGLLSYVI